MCCSVVAKDFPNGLGKFTPCFTNVAILGMRCCCPIHIRRTKPTRLQLAKSAIFPAGVAHTIGVILCLIRIFLSQHSKGAEKYRLSSTARLVHVFAVIVAAANLLLVLFLLNGRIAADTILVVHGHVAPFEWVGEPHLTLCHLHPYIPSGHDPFALCAVLHIQRRLVCTNCCISSRCSLLTISLHAAAAGNFQQLAH